jgi:hypothetical protein
MPPRDNLADLEREVSRLRGLLGMRASMETEQPTARLALKPGGPALCMFCQSRDTMALSIMTGGISITEPIGDGWQVACRSCNARGPICANEYLSVLSWNLRRWTIRGKT